MSKHDRLRNINYIKMLFQQGKSCYKHPFKIFYLKRDKALSPCHKVLFAIPKSRVPLAVERNRLKRLLKEAYRTHKYILDVSTDLVACPFVFFIGYVYYGKRKGVKYPVVNNSVIASLQHLKTLLHST